MNPLIWRKGVCDPHMHVFEDKVYLYATHDAPGHTDGFYMEDWQIWSSEDLIDWRLESVVRPEDFYCGGLNQCWALDAASKEGKYYLYFSTGDWGVGVGVSDNPAGPFEDVLGEALADYRVYPVGVQKWDPCVFIDDDGSAYLIAGTSKNVEPWDCYLIAKLEDDMIHLAEPMRRLEYIGNPWPEDKASIHKYGGRYYLTHSSYYAVSDNVYGPYEYVGNTGCNIDHGSYFTYKNQTYFASGGMDNPNPFLRASFLAPCHYRENGEIVIDQKIMEYGCGQYDAVWERIDAAWYFAASRECKVECGDGSFAAALLQGEYLYFPNIANIEENAVLKICASGAENAVIIIREDSLDGKSLGQCSIGEEKGIYEVALQCSHGKKSLYFVVEGSAEISWFSFQSNKKRYTLEPMVSRVGRGASLTYDVDASNHQVLQNMELRGAGMEGLADGGAGGEGILKVPYYCTGSDVQLNVFVNGEPQGKLDFPVTGQRCLGKTPKVSKMKVQLSPGLNKIRVASEDGYQMGRLAIDHITVESKFSNCGVCAAANALVEPMGNGCWDGFPQRESDPHAFSGRMVKHLGKPGDSITFEKVDGGEGGIYVFDIHYCRGEAGGSVYEILVNDVNCGEVEFGETGGFSAEYMKSLKVEIMLETGEENKICLRKTGEVDQGIYVDACSFYHLSDM